jgi:hypothetical protein
VSQRVKDEEEFVQLMEFLKSEGVEKKPPNGTKDPIKL